MTAYAKLKAYARACGNGSSFQCLVVCNDPYNRVWQARIQLWWLNLVPLVASGRTRGLACKHLGEIVEDYDATWKEP